MIQREQRFYGATAANFCSSAAGQRAGTAGESTGRHGGAALLSARTRVGVDAIEDQQLLRRLTAIEHLDQMRDWHCAFFQC